MTQAPHLNLQRAVAAFSRYCTLAATALAGLSMFVAGCQASPKDEEPVRAVAYSPSPSSELDKDGEELTRRLTQNKTVDTQQSPTSPLNSDADLTWHLDIDADFNLARTLVEDELNVDLQDITLALVDDVPINTEVSFETQRLIKSQFGDSAFARKLLGQVMDPLSGTYAAVYSSRLRSVMISRSMLQSYERSVDSTRADPSDRAGLLSLLIHELVHAADDKRFRIHDNRALSFRASFAQSATFEGHAQWVTRRICEQASCSQGLQDLDNFMFNTDETDLQLTQPVDAISRNVLEYSYVEGERFIAGLAERENGKQLIEKLLGSPPSDPVQILSPETYPDNAREKRNQQLISAGRNVNHPWAAPSWVSVETSPLKGVDLRTDPVRRQAAVDGFTKLIDAMVSMQLYDQKALNALPIEATILRAESVQTAKLFASMMHSNIPVSDAKVSDERLSIYADATYAAQAPMQVHIYRTTIDGDTNFQTAIAVAGEHVVQVSGSMLKRALLDDYAIRVLQNLEGG